MEKYILQFANCIRNILCNEKNDHRQSGRLSGKSCVNQQKKREDILFTWNNHTFQIHLRQLWFMHITCHYYAINLYSLPKFLFWKKNYMNSLSLGTGNDEWLEVRVTQGTLNYLLPPSVLRIRAILICHDHFQPEQLQPRTLHPDGGSRPGAIPCVDWDSFLYHLYCGCNGGTASFSTSQLWSVAFTNPCSSFSPCWL